MYEAEAKVVQQAIAAFRVAANAEEVAGLEYEQQAAGSSALEWYGRTARVFERFLASHAATGETRDLLERGIHSVRVILGAAQ